MVIKGINLLLNNLLDSPISDEERGAARDSHIEKDASDFWAHFSSTAPAATRRSPRRIHAVLFQRKLLMTGLVEHSQPYAVGEGQYIDLFDDSFCQYIFKALSDS